MAGGIKTLLNRIGLVWFSYEDSDIALSYGAILRECIRHQVVAR